MNKERIAQLNNEQQYQVFGGVEPTHTQRDTCPSYPPACPNTAYNTCHTCVGVVTCGNCSTPSITVATIDTCNILVTKPVVLQTLQC